MSVLHDLIVTVLAATGAGTWLVGGYVAMAWWREHDYRCPWDPEVRRDRADLERIRGRR